MQEARTVIETNVKCPACGKDDFVVFRRLSTGGGGIRNLCRCERCDESFYYEEDKAGNLCKNS